MWKKKINKLDYSLQWFYWQQDILKENLSYSAYQSTIHISGKVYGICYIQRSGYMPIVIIFVWDVFYCAWHYNDATLLHSTHPNSTPLTVIIMKFILEDVKPSYCFIQLEAEHHLKLEHHYPYLILRNNSSSQPIDAYALLRIRLLFQQ